MDPAVIPKPSRLPLAVFALVAALLAGAGLLLHRSMRDGARARGAAELDAVAALKASAVIAWRGERESDTAYAGSFPFVAAAVRDPAAASHGQAVYDGLAARHGLSLLALLTPEGKTLVEHRTAAAPAIRPGLLSRARTSPGPVSAFTAEAGDKSPRLDIAVPIRESGAVVAVVYSSLDAGPFLASVVAGWPVPSATGEAVVVRPDRDAVLFVTDPRFLQGWALRRRIPFSEDERGVVRAVRGEGVFSGVDLNGTSMLVASRRVPDSDWLVATRMDLAEIEAPILRPAAVIGWGLLLLLAACGAALLLWRGHELRQHAALVSAREALEESRERFRLALAGTHLVWDWDLVRGVLDADPLWAAQLGVAAAALRGTPREILALIAHPDDVADAEARLEAHATGAALVFEAEFRSNPGNGTGPLRWVLLRGRASRRDGTGRAQRITGVVSDVTERRALQATLARAERMASLGTLAAGLAHEINNPLAYLIDNLELLAEQLTAGGRPELVQAVADARDGASRVREVVQGLRVFSRQGPGRRVAVDVGAELSAAVRLSSNQLRHRARLELRVGPLPRVLAGEHELGQVFLNLLLNAAQAIPEGHVTENLVVVVAATDEQGNARVEVRDSGSGIAPEILPRIFEPFFTTKPLALGTGLGLAIAHGIVVAAGGHIEVESKPGSGTVFRVLLPPAPTEAPAAEAPAVAPPAPSAAPVGDRPRVLVIDDDALVARTLARSLGPGFAVETEISARRALQRLEAREPFAAVVCDLMMPEMTGMELYQRALAADPALEGRFLFVTGGAFTDSAREFLERTAAPWVGKPFQPAELRALVGRLAARPGAGGAPGVR